MSHHRRAKTSHRAVPPPGARHGSDWIVVALSGAAFAISVYLATLKLAGSAPLFCEAGSGCDVVQASRWANFLGIPTAAWGAVLYAALALVGASGLTARRWVWAFVLATAAVSVAAYLTAIELFVLHAICVYCAITALLAVALFVGLLLRRPAGGKHSPTRPGRVVAVGVATAVVTLVVTAGVWVMEPASATTGYGEGLARHLTATKSIMYGAFW